MRRSRALMAACAALSALVAADAVAQDGARVTVPDADGIDPGRFGEKVPDAAYGAFQRGRYLTALELAMPRAEAGDAAAQILVAEIHSRGLGVRRDQEEAAKWYELAAEQGSAEGRFRLAMLLIEGEAVPADTERATALMEQAADAGNPDAQFNLAQLILSREASRDEFERAIGYFEQAADAGLADAQYAMAQVHQQGAGDRPVDMALARQWLERAARQNFDSAQLDLGTWLIEGQGGERNREQGFAWLMRAARAGNVAARNRVAKLYRAGVGTNSDPVAAAYWYMLASRAGLSDPLMEDYLDGLAEDDLAEASRRVGELR